MNSMVLPARFLMTSPISGKIVTSGTVVLETANLFSKAKARETLNLMYTQRMVNYSQKTAINMQISKSVLPSKAPSTGDILSFLIIENNALSEEIQEIRKDVQYIQCIIEGISDTDDKKIDFLLKKLAVH